MEYFSSLIFILLTLNFTSSFPTQLSVHKYIQPKLCERNYTENIPVQRTYQESYKTGFIFRRTKYRTKYVTEMKPVVVTQKVCCNGYKEYQGRYCIPICDKECIHGECWTPNVCMCNTGYTLLASANHVCIPECKNCFNGRCIAPDTCSCHSGYHLSTDELFCEPICKNCGNYGYCIAPDTCKCINGYAMDLTKSECVPRCNKTCVNGECKAPNLCNCHDGYHLNADGFTCDPSCGQCSEYQYCAAPSTCKCIDGYSLDSSSTCVPVCEKDCVNGDCVSPNRCECHDGYAKDVNNSFVEVCQPLCPHCINGICTSEGTCLCYSGYQKSPNDIYTCNSICSEDCIMGTCIAPEVCSCLEGYRLSNFSNYLCEPVCNQTCVNGKCIEPDFCECFDGFEMKSVNNRSACYPICECENGFCSDAEGFCEKCMDGYVLTVTENYTSCEPRCEGGCANGTCIAPEECECDVNYILNNSTNGNQICTYACGAECVHGNCLYDDRRCDCFFGWTGNVCDIPLLCSLNFADNDTFVGLENRTNIFDNSENLTEILVEIPTCDNKCFFEMDNITKCINDETISLIVCFIETDSPCNSNELVTSIFEKRISPVLWISSTVVGVIVTAMILTCVLFIRKREKPPTPRPVQFKNLEQIQQLIRSEDE